MTTSNELFPYELALLQFRADVTSEELVNIGVVAMRTDSPQLEVVTSERAVRAKAMFSDLDTVAFRGLVRSLTSRANTIRRDLQTPRLAMDGPTTGIEDYLEKIVPAGSSNFVWSTVRYGVCADLQVRANAVFQEYVRRHELHNVRDRVDDDLLWRRIAEDDRVAEMLPLVNTPKKVEGEGYSHEFRASWMNGHLQLAEPISLDYAQPGSVETQALKWNGIVNVLASANEFSLTAIVTDPPTNDSAASKKYYEAIGLLARTENVREVIPVSNIVRFRELVELDLGHLTP